MTTPDGRRLDPVDAAWLYPLVTSQYRDGAFSRRPEGLSRLYGTLGNSPAMLSRWLDFAWSLRYEPTSSRQLRELAILLVGHRLAAPYCIAAHDRLATDEGVSPEQLAAIPQWQQSDLFDDDQRVVLALAEAMVQFEVDDADVAAIRERFGPEQTVEIVLTVAFYQMVASTTKTLGLVPDMPPADWRPPPVVT